MPVRPRFAAAALTVALAGCAALHRGAGEARPARPPGASGLFVFARGDLAPVEAAFARREDGTLAPLDVRSLPAAARPDAERVWLTGWIPPGPYAGLELHAGSDTVVDVPLPFTATADDGTVLVAGTAGPNTATGEASSILLVKPPAIASGLLGLVSVRGWDALELFDKRSGRVARVLPVGRSPGGIAVDTDRLRAYVAVAGDDAVAVVDLLEERLRERVILRGGDAPLDVAVTPDGRTLLVANSGSDTVSFVDTVAAVERERVAVGARPVSLVMAPDGRKAYVVAERGTAVTVLDVPARAVAGTIATDVGPIQARLGGRAGEILYVAHAGSPYLLVADAPTLSIQRRVYVGNGARAIEVEPKTGRIVLARAGQRKVEVFDPGSFLPVDEIALGGDAAYLALETEGNALGVLVPGLREADLFGNVGRRLQTVAAVGPEPWALRFVDAR